MVVVVVVVVVVVMVVVKVMNHQTSTVALSPHTHLDGR